MSTQGITIDIDRELDDGVARPVVARIKAALRNHIPSITLRLGATARIRSPSFLAFLEAVRQHLETAEASLRISCPSVSGQELLEQFGFAGILDSSGKE